MAFQAVPDTASVVTNYIGGNKPVQMTFYAEFLGGYSPADLVVLASNVDNRVVSDFLPIQTNNIIYSNTTVRGLNAENDLEVTDADGTGPGGVVGKGLPNNVTFALKRLSGLTGRSARGRVFWLGMPDTDLDANENFVAGAAATTILAAFDGMRIALGLSGWSAVLVSRISGGVKRDPAITFPWVSSAITDERVDSHRGRLP